MESNDYDIVIIGGGVSGLSLLYFLQKHKKYKVLLLEKDANKKHQGYSLTMRSHPRRIFEEYNLITQINKLGKRAKRQHFYNSDGTVIYCNDQNDTLQLI